MGIQMLINELCGSLLAALYTRSPWESRYTQPLLSCFHPSAAIADKVAVPSDNTSASIHTATVLLFISSTPIPDLHSTEAT